MLAPTLIAGLYGLIIGSFLNALVWRVKVGRSIAKGRSICPECHHVLAARDLVPLLSWVMLGGSCRYCRRPISWQYPVVEALTAVLFGLSYWIITPASALQWFSFVVWLMILGCFVFLAVFDLRWLILPDVVQMPAIGLAAVWLVVVGLAGGSWLFGWHHLLAGIIGGGIFYALASLGNGGLMGGGDVKLVFIMGLLLGLRNLLVALVVSFNVAAIIGIVLILLHKRGRRDPVPFGPFLVLGATVGYLYGDVIINWYLHLNGVA